MSEQPGWRWCSRCQGLVYSGFGSGVCFDGSPHELSGSGFYRVRMSEEATEQDMFRWCNGCQALLSITFGNGVCWDDRPHDPSASGPYRLMEGVAEGAQYGWRRCNRCQGLAFGGDEGGAVGACHDGDPHFLSDLAVFSVPHEAAAPDQAPPLPAVSLRITEREHRLQVTGDGCTPSSAVELSFARGLEVRKVRLTTDETGVAYYDEHQAEVGHGGGEVVLLDLATNASAAGRTEYLFPRRPPGLVVIDHGTEIEPG